MNWQQVKAAGYSFAILKLTDNLSYRYVTWGRANLPLVMAAGLIPGVYHWLHAGDGAAQARVYVDEVNRLGGFQGVLAVVDVEKDEDGTFPSYATVKAFCAEFRRLVPSNPLIIYTGKWFWTGYLGDPDGASLGLLWHSEYEPSQAEVEDGPELDTYGRWTHATFWQFTSSGSVPGVSTACDLNRFFGTRDDLLALTQGEDDMALTKDETKAAVKEVMEELWGSPGTKVRQGAEDVLERIGNPGTQAGKAFAAGVHAALDDIVEPFAAAVASKLAGSADAAAVKVAVREAFAEVTSRFEFTPPET